ncbi:hypothetical protein BACPU_11660 [Bacillus pumilus]|nr:hypothetical protein BACPU_11660 [Bacillus pumilus]
MIHKNGPLDFNVNAFTSSSVSTSINFWTQDRQTARLTFKLTKDGVPLPLAAVTGKLVLVMSDGSRFIRDITIIDRVDGQAEYILSDQEVKHYGNVQAELNLYYTNDQSMSVHQFSFNISKSLIDQDIVPITEYYVAEFEDLRAKINELYKESIHKIDDLRAKFNDLDAFETKDGAQDKADAALATAKKYTDDHANNHEIHVVKNDKDKWNNGQLYKLTPDDGKVKQTPKDVNLFSLGTGYYMGWGLASLPVANDTSWYYFEVLETSHTNGLKRIIATRSSDNRTWIGTFHTNGFTGWKRILTDDELSSTWNQVTLTNGMTKQFAGNPLKFSIRQNAIHLRGSFEGIPANDAVIARFAQKPKSKSAFLAATVGSYGSARFTLDTDGSLRFDGMSANDSSYVSRFEINEEIQLW